MTAPILFAIEEFPQLRPVVDRGFDKPGDMDLVSQVFLFKSAFDFSFNLFPH